MNTPTPYVYPGITVSNYDGDTLTAELDLGMGIKCKAVCRLLGLDAPEIKAKTANEKAAALAAKQRLAALLASGPLVFHSTAKPDKYGRLLVRIWAGDVCVNDALLTEKLAVPYDGGEKAPFQAD
jgi:hypothetical protein